MTSLERVFAVFEGNRPDRVPVIPIVGQAAARLNGMTMGAELSSPEALATSRIACLGRFHYDGIYISADTWVTAEAMGAPVLYSDEVPVEGTTPLLENRNKLDQLRSPNPTQDGRMPLLVKAVEIASRRSNDQFAVIGNFDQSPFSLACQLRGINQLMRDVYDNPVFVKKLLEICTESVIRYAKALAGAGAHILNTGDSPAMLMGPENYENFARPYEQIVFDELTSYGIPSTLHICGDTTRMLELMGKNHAQGVELDFQVDLPLARKRLPEDMTLIGNIEPVGVMLEARPDQVIERITHFLDSSSQLGRFILSTGCALAPDTPPENLHAMIEAVMNYEC